MAMRFLTNVDISNFYANFVNLDKQDFDVIIEEFQANKNLIGLLSVEQQLELKIIYLEALYQIGKYGSFLREVDEIIEDCIRYHRVDQPHREVYEELLFKKSTALFHQGFVQQSEYVTTELVKINPEKTLYQALLTRIYYRKNESRFHFIKVFCLFLIVFSALVYGSNLLIVYYFYGEHLPVLFDVGFFTLNIGVLVYVISEICLFGEAIIRSRRKVRQATERKSRKEQ
ncbi:hypothetical protein KUV50_08320 [Membranicola marinus]|uniref:Uncharacterized protein n=1 Tax=Membranihabitans marinus TaxID=1227546 RepID=A0A953HTH5_9BACT|nr:hypothetical protein [Membranihabitans marinus]MBY5958130.1 hypothetical protein [Membranihabitans marinus]